MRPALANCLDAQFMLIIDARPRRAFRNRAAVVLQFAESAELGTINANQFPFVKPALGRRGAGRFGRHNSLWECEAPSPPRDPRSLTHYRRRLQRQRLPPG